MLRFPVLVEFLWQWTLETRWVEIPIPIVPESIYDEFNFDPVHDPSVHFGGGME